MPELSVELQQKLLCIARETMEEYIRYHAISRLIEEPELTRKCGAFVTITSSQRLRGCIGYVEGFKPLYQTVIDMAIAASTQDPRFEPVREQELSDLQLEISVMSPLRKIADPQEVEVGVHGILLKRGVRSGLLLPPGGDRISLGSSHLLNTPLKGRITARCLERSEFWNLLYLAHRCFMK